MKKVLCRKWKIKLEKIGKKDKVKKYRPITLLSPISTKFEKSFVNIVSLLQEKNTILVPQNQFRLRKNLFTLDLKNKSLALFIDIQNAFVMVPHEVLLDKKLHFIGVREIALSWF